MRWEGAVVCVSVVDILIVVVLRLQISHPVRYRDDNDDALAEVGLTRRDRHSGFNSNHPLIAGAISATIGTQA